MKKIIKRIVIGLIVLGLGYYLFQWGVYFVLQGKANKEMFMNWYSEQYIPQDYRGFIENVRIDECFWSLWIETSGEESPVRYTFDCGCKDKDFMKFVSEGDSVIKKSGEEKITFIKKDGRSRSFDPPYCK